MSKEKLAENMRNLRIMNGYSVNEIAEMVNRAPNTILNWEKAKVSPDVDIVEDLCGIYGVSPSEIFGWSKCKKLEEFLAQKKEILKEMDMLQKEKAEIEKRLRVYTEILNRRENI